MFPFAKNIAQFCFFPKPNLGGIVSHPFGSVLSSVSKGEYRYGMNTQEKDNEIYGEGNSYTAEYWQYDARLARRWNVDPVVKQFQSPYVGLRNNPLFYSDPFGDDETSGNKKGDRSMNKYEKKFNKEKKRNPELSKDKIHENIEDKYNDKRWMWVKDKTENGKKDLDHVEYYHAGDLYRQSIGDKKNEQTTTVTNTLTLNPTEIHVAPSNGLGSSSIILYEYDISGQNGLFSLPLEANNGTYTYNLSQVDDVGNSTSIAGPVTVDGNHSNSFNVNVNSDLGSTLVLSATVSNHGGGISTGANPTANGTLTTSTTVTTGGTALKALHHKAVRTGKSNTTKMIMMGSGSKIKPVNPNRLGPGTRDQLNDYRIRIN
jgi:hypothetical protein